MEDNFDKYLEKVKALSPEEKAKIKDRLYQGNPVKPVQSPEKG